MKKLSGRNALVTGASRKVGIGAAVARALSEEGANVFLTYWTSYDDAMPWGSRPDEVSSLVGYLAESCGRSGSLEVDLSEAGAAERVVSAAERAIGPLDILVNNAAMNVDQGLYELSAGALDKVFAVNARAPMLLTAEFARRHDGRPGGRVISLTSGQGVHPMPDELPYAASKGALEAFTKSASGTLGAKGITINAIDPGATDTGWMTPAVAKEIAEQNPQGRVGRPQDVANLVLFLASEAGAWVSGQVLRSRGGV